MESKRPGGLAPLVQNGLLLLLCLLSFGLALFLPLLSALGEEDLTQEEALLLRAYERKELIRLHILANSDSPEDQRVKLLVRDAVLDAFGRALTQAGETGPEQVYRLLERSLPALETLAQESARNYGFTGEVSARVGLLSLPEKRYGRVTLPAGKYRGLEIVLGSGQGHNWWCVLFPSLCLALAQEEPWQSQPGEQPSPPEVTWEAERILAHWPAYIPAASPPPALETATQPAPERKATHSR